MKKNILVSLIRLALFAGSAFSARAQNFAIDWFTTDGGGGTSAGGVYSVSGTVGQPDAGMLSGGRFSLSGGFLSVVAAVQMTNAPRLSVRLSPTRTVIIFWPASASGYELEQNADLNPANWTKVGTAPMTVGEEKQVVVPTPVGNRFFRLRKP